MASETLPSLTLLRHLPIFSRVPDEALEKIARIAHHRRVSRGVTLVHAGDHTDSLYVLINGSIKVMNTNEEGREVILAILGPGEFFGEMGMIDGSPRSATIVSTEPCELLTITKEDFRHVLSENFEITLQIMKSLVHRLREADRKIESLALQDVHGRVGKLLLDFSDIKGGRRIVTRKLTKQDIAKMVGASREMVSRVMKDLEARGFYSLDGSTIVIRQE
jgi:CRP/FNR family cyclic AMP-dependent transcriptional regulator